MPVPRSSRPIAAALVVAAASLLAYPVLRGYATEDGLAAAELYARPAWLAAHALAMLGFGLVAWALGAYSLPAMRRATIALALLLPYYGAEAYGLHAVGQRVLETGDVAMLTAGDGAADMFRYQPLAMTLFGLGWLALAAAGGQFARVTWPEGGLVRVGGALVAIGLATYLPQFFVPPTGRVLHGVVIAVGLLVVAVAGLRSRASAPRVEVPRVAQDSSAPAGVA